MVMVLPAYFEHLLETVLVFLLLFGVIAYLFARGRFLPLLRGFGRVILSFFICPFSYLRAAVLSMADHGADAGADVPASKQYLLNKLMLTLQAALVLASVAVFAWSVTDGWNSMLPPKLLRTSIRELDKAVIQKTADLQKLEPAVKQLEDAWKGQREAQMESFTTGRGIKIEQLGKANLDLAARIKNVDPQTKMLFAKIEEFHARNAGDLSAGELEECLNSLNAYMERLNLAGDAKALIQSYNENWGQIKRLKIEIDNMSERQVRTAAQPAYETMAAQLAEIKRDLPVQGKQLALWRSEVKYQPEKLLLSVLYGALKLILLVWLFGLLIEILWSAINVSSDVRKIQGSFKPLDT